MTKTQKKTYVRTRIKDNVIKHLTSKFKKNFIKSFVIAENVFDDLNRVFDDCNQRINALKSYKQLKQIRFFRKFYIFWIELQRLTSDSKLYDEETFLMNLKNKMFFDLQKVLTFDIYKTIDLYEFVKLCQFIDQILRDENIKFRNVKDEWEKSVLRRNFNNQESFREQSNISNLKFQFETFKSNANNNQKSNNCEMSWSLAFDQMNALICYNYDKADHMTCNYQVCKKMNLNNFLKR